jgi:hypothetical protein
MKAKLAGKALFAAVILTAGAKPTLAQERIPTAISDIRQESSDHSTRLIIVCTGPLAYTYYSPDPLTLVVDIPEVDASKIPSRISVGTREVESLRVTSLARADGRNLARLEVRLASLVPYQIFSRGKDLNLVFERPTSAAARPPEPAPAVPAPAAVSAAPAPAEVAKDEPPAPSPDKVAAARPEKAAPPEKAVPKNAPHATQILGVAQAEDAGQLIFTVRANGRLQYQDFFLGNPDRLVVDFPDVTARAAVRALEVNQKPVRKVRLAQFSVASPKVARLVLDLSARAPYRSVEGADGL